MIGLWTVESQRTRVRGDRDWELGAAGELFFSFKGFDA
jgi:hypothetical protein